MVSCCFFFFLSEMQFISPPPPSISEVMSTITIAKSEPFNWRSIPPAKVNLKVPLMASQRSEVGGAGRSANCQSISTVSPPPPTLFSARTCRSTMDENKEEEEGEEAARRRWLFTFGTNGGAAALSCFSVEAGGDLIDCQHALFLHTQLFITASIRRRCTFILLRGSFFCLCVLLASVCRLRRSRRLGLWRSARSLVAPSAECRIQFTSKHLLPFVEASRKTRTHTLTPPLF